MPRRRTPRQARDRLALGRYQILQVFTDRLLISKIVILLQQAVEQRLPRRAPHLLKLQRTQVSQWSAHRTVVGHNGFGPLTSFWPVRRSTPRWRQLDRSRTIQHEQQSPAHHVAPRAVGLLPLPSFTNSS